MPSSVVTTAEALQAWRHQQWWAQALRKRKPKSWGLPRPGRLVQWDEEAGELEALDVTDAELLAAIRPYLGEETPSIRSLLRWSSQGLVAKPGHSGRSHRRDWPDDAPVDTIIACWLLRWGEPPGMVAEAKRLARGLVVPASLVPPEVVEEATQGPIWRRIEGGLKPKGRKDSAPSTLAALVMDRIRAAVMLLGPLKERRLPWDPAVVDVWRWKPGEGLELRALVVEDWEKPELRTIWTRDASP